MTALLVVFMVLQAFDFYSTYRVIKSGKGHEDNPFMANAIYEVGLIPTLIIKTAFASASGYWLYSEGQVVVLAVLDVFYCYFMVKNLIVLRSTK